MVMFSTHNYKATVEERDAAEKLSDSIMRALTETSILSVAHRNKVDRMAITFLTQMGIARIVAFWDKDLQLERIS